MILCYFLQSADRSEENIAHGKSAATSDDNCISQEKNDDGKWKDYIHHTLECTYYIHEITSYFRYDHTTEKTLVHANHPIKTR